MPSPAKSWAASHRHKANYVGGKAVGDFIKAKVFEPARTMTWNGLTRHATGSDLNPKAFAADFQG